MAEQLPIWQDSGVEPPALLKTNGWQPGMKPSAQHMNWLFNRIYKCLEEIQAGGGTEELEQELKDLQLAFATHLTAKATLNEIGHVQLSNLITGTSETKAATEKAVKEAKEEAINFAKSFGLGNNAVDISSSNLNHLDATGFYKGTTVVNAPTNGWWFFINFKHDAQYRTQLAVGFSGSGRQIFHRNQDGGIWGGWAQYISSEHLNQPWGVPGLDGAGKMYPSVMPSGGDNYSLISSLGLSGQTSVSVAGLNAYRKLKVVFKDVNFGTVGLSNTFAITFNDNNTLLGTVSGSRINAQTIISDTDNTRSAVWLTTVAGNTISSAFMSGIVTFDKCGEKLWSIWGQTASYRSDFKSPANEATTLSSFGGNAAALNKMTFGISGQPYAMIGGTIEVWGAM